MSISPIQVMEKLTDGEMMTRDIYSRLLEDRIIFMHGDLESDLGNSVVVQLLYLAGVSEDLINIYINSDGGVLTEALAIHDTMKYIKPVVRTVCIGQACSAAAIVLASGEKGHRVALPSSRILLHQLSGGMSGSRDQMVAYAKESNRLMDVVINILIEQTGKEVEEIKVDLQKELFMSPEEAVKYGIIDKIIKGKNDHD